MSADQLVLAFWFGVAVMLVLSVAASAGLAREARRSAPVRPEPMPPRIPAQRPASAES